MGLLGPVVSVCAKFANRQTDGWMDGRRDGRMNGWMDWCQMPGYVMSLLTDKISKTKYDPSGQNWNCTVPKFDWPQELCPRHAWCEFAKDLSKSQRLTAHRKNEVGSVVATNVTNGWWKMDWSPDLGSKNIWVNLKKIHWKICSAECTQENIEVGNLIATNITNGWHKNVLGSGPWPKNICCEKIHYKLKSVEHIEGKRTWPLMDKMDFQSANN